MGIWPARPGAYPRRNPSQRYPRKYPANCVREGIDQNDSPPAHFTNRLKKQQQIRAYTIQIQTPSITRKITSFRLVSGAIRAIFETYGQSHESASGMPVRKTGWNLQFTAWYALKK
jgi:hypothetical protein